jgi:hypothetical protein
MIHVMRVLNGFYNHENDQCMTLIPSYRIKMLQYCMNILSNMAQHDPDALDELFGALSNGDEKLISALITYMEHKWEQGCNGNPDHVIDPEVMEYIEISLVPEESTDLLEWVVLNQGNPP